MKMRFISSILAFAMVVSTAFPVMAAPAKGEDASMGTVIIDNVPGGAVVAYVDEGSTRMYLPIGEEVRLPEGTCVDFMSIELFYYEEEDGTDSPFINTICQKITVATSADADKAMVIPGEGVSVRGKYEVEAGETAHIKASFAKRDMDQSEEVNIDLEQSLYRTEEEAVSAKIEKIELEKRYADQKSELIEIPFSQVELTNVRFHEMDWEKGRYEDAQAGRFEYDSQTGEIRWSEPLKYGVYRMVFRVTHEGKTFETDTVSLYVGGGFNYIIPLGFYPYWKNSDKMHWAASHLAIYFSTFEGTADRLWDEIDGVLPDGIEEFGLYNYEKFDGWYINDNWELVKVPDSEKVENLASNYGLVTFYGRFKNAEGELYSVDIERLEGEGGDVTNPDKPDKPDLPGVPDTDEELKTAVDNLAQTTPPSEDAPAEEKAKFDAQVKTVADSIEKKVKAGEAVDIQVIRKMEQVLEEAYGVEVQVEDGFEAEGLLLAAGMTSYEATEDVSAVRLYKKGQIATVSNATKTSANKVTFELAARLVKMTRAAEEEITELKAPVTLTVPMPEYYIATTSDAERDVVKSGSRELDMKREGDSITFTTTKLGKFTVGAKAGSGDNNGGNNSGDNGNNNGGNNSGNNNGGNGGGRPSGGSSGGGSSRRSTGASGTWQIQDGRWWFKYTNGTYPADKWEFINSKWYYFDSQGYMVTGWQLISGKWYFLDAVNGDMATGWKLDGQDGRWYYLDEVNGDMVTGWRLINGKWYYLNDQAGETATWNYNTETSAWEYTGSAVRPFGSMYANELTPDGYRVDADGAWVTE